MTEKSVDRISCVRAINAVNILYDILSTEVIKVLKFFYTKKNNRIWFMIHGALYIDSPMLFKLIGKYGDRSKTAICTKDKKMVLST